MYTHSIFFAVSNYTFFGFLSVIALLTYNYLNFVKHKNSSGLLAESLTETVNRKTKKNFSLSIIIAEIFVVSELQYGLITPFNNLFGSLFTDGSANYFGMLNLQPIVFILGCILFGIKPIEKLDLVTPAYPLALIFSKIGCFCAGCCTGFEWIHGISNAKSEKTDFPSQLLEAAAALILFIFILNYKKRAKKGTVFPVYFISYSFLRFFTEFTRCEDNILGPFKAYQLLCFEGIILGLIELFLLTKFSDKIDLMPHKLYEWFSVKIEQNKKIKVDEKKIKKSHHNKRHKK